MAEGKRYSIPERIFMVKSYYETKNQTEVVRRFNEQFGHDVAQKTVKMTVEKFEETGTYNFIICALVL